MMLFRCGDNKTGISKLYLLAYLCIYLPARTQDPVKLYHNISQYE